MCSMFIKITSTNIAPVWNVYILQYNHCTQVKCLKFEILSPFKIFSVFLKILTFFQIQKLAQWPSLDFTCPNYTLETTGYGNILRSMFKAMMKFGLTMLWWVLIPWIISWEICLRNVNYQLDSLTIHFIPQWLEN